MRIQLSSWQLSRSTALPIRLEVFVNEQNVPIELEEDAFDHQAIHAILFLNHLPIGTARLFQEDPQSHVYFIGRLCVLSEYRQQGYGRALMQSLLEVAKSNEAKMCFIHAQSNAHTFYESIGFQVCSPPFMEAGIEHLMMQYRY
jgi:predicted GNAT family N-acyltransferase